MLHNHKNLARLLTAGLAIAAIAPATAGAMPTIDGQAVAAGGGPAVTPQSLTAPDQVDRVGHATQDLRAPDQVDGGVVGAQPNNAPQWPVNPQPIGHAGTKAAAKPSNGLGTEAIVLIALGGVALVATAGLGLARQRRVRAGRQRQLA
jgi:hypothetical protein